MFIDQWTQLAPAHWTRKRLKHIASLRSGESITTDSIKDDGEFPVFGGNGIRGYSSAYTHQGEFVLIGRQGALCGNVNYARERFWASEHAIVVTRLADDDLTWLGELLRYLNLNRLSQSAAQPGISAEEVSNVLLAVPPLIEQRAISAYLQSETARLDALVAAKQRVLDLLAEKRKAIIGTAVKRGLDSKVKVCDSGLPWLGEIPVHWGMTRLKFVAQVQTGVTLGKDYGGKESTEFPYLRVANVQDGFIDLTVVKTIVIPQREASSAMLRRGDVLMNEGGDADKLGRGAIWDGSIDPCLHQNHVFALRPTLVSSEWLSVWIGADFAKAYFETRAKRSTNLASISSTNLLELPIAVPTDNEQRAVVEHIARETTKLDAVRVATERTIALLKERRASFIAAAVTGHLDFITRDMGR